MRATAMPPKAMKAMKGAAKAKAKAKVAALGAAADIESFIARSAMKEQSESEYSEDESDIA